MTTTKTYLDTRSIKDNQGIIKIMVIHNRMHRLFSTGIKISVEDWEKFTQNITKDGLNGRIKNEEFIELYAKLYETFTEFGKTTDGYVARARKIIEHLGKQFTFENFKYAFKNYHSFKTKNDKENDVFVQYDAMMATLLDEERIGSALSYQVSRNSIQRFLLKLDNHQRFELKLPKPKKVGDLYIFKLMFEQITVDFLLEYEKWMLTYGKLSQKANENDSPASASTVGIYLRQLRAIFNKAIADGITTHYPFGKRAYRIPGKRNIKKALTKREILSIIQYDTAGQDLFIQRSKDFWVFSYLSNGMNFFDILQLKWSDFNPSENTITFVREKTARTTKENQKSITIYLRDLQLQVIEKWGSKDSVYIFPFINTEMDAVTKKNSITQFIQVTNKWTKRIGQELGLQKPVTTYTARHSFATILLRSEAPIAFISQSLGHTNISTTEAYLGSFEEDKAREYLGELL